MKRVSPNNYRECTLCWVFIINNIGDDGGYPLLNVNFVLGVSHCQISCLFRSTL